MKTIKKLYSYLFAEIEGSNLGIFRILTSIVTIVMMISLIPDLLNIFGSNGYFNQEIMDVFKSSLVPRIEWILTPLKNLFGLSEQVALFAILFLYMGSLILLLLGVATRVSAFFSFLFCAMFTGSGAPFIYGVDYFILSCLFYCFLFPVSNSFTIFHLTGKKTNYKVLRIYTIFILAHLCMVYFFNGIAKSLGETWYSGEAIWRAVMLLDTRQYNMAFLADFPNFLKYSSLTVLCFELFFPLLILKRITRIPTIIVIFSTHVFIGLFMGLYFFAAIMITLNITVFYNEYILIIKKVKYYFEIVLKWSIGKLSLANIQTIRKIKTMEH